MRYSLYLISALTDGILQWKIGLSKHPNKRITELKTANPNIQQIDALYEIRNRQVAYKTEALLKKNLKSFQISGEWIEGYALNQTLFIEYCTMYEEIAQTLIEIENNKIENKLWK